MKKKREPDYVMIDVTILKINPNAYLLNRRLLAQHKFKCTVEESPKVSEEIFSLIKKHGKVIGDNRKNKDLI